MGQCFSFTTRRGRKKLHIGVVQKSFNSTGTGKSSATSESRITVDSKYTDECEVEPASGLFSTGSDYSAVCMGAEELVEKPPLQKFGWHLAQEKKMESLERTPDRTKEKKWESPARPPAMVAMPQAMPSSKVNGHLKASPGQKSVERKPPERNSVERNPSERKAVERTGVASIADVMNRKGRGSLEMIRASTPENTNGLQKSRSRNGRESASPKSLPAGSRQSLPVDFGYFAKQFAIENSIQQLGKDREPRSVLADQKEPAASPMRRDFLTIDEVTKTYKESAAKAAARDRDSFKSMAEDISISSSIGGSVADSVASGFGASPSFKPRRNSHSRSASFLAEPESEIMESPVNLRTLLKDADDRLRNKARSPSMPKPPSVTRNRSYPSGSPRGFNTIEARPGAKYAHLLLTPKSSLRHELSKLGNSPQGRGPGGGNVFE